MLGVWTQLCESKISNLENASVVDEELGLLLVTVDNTRTTSMQIQHPLSKMGSVDNLVSLPHFGAMDEMCFEDVEQ